MKLRYLFIFLCTGFAVVSCKKPNEVSKIPQISLLRFASGDGSDSMLVNIDTVFLNFTITDGDADLGVPQPGPLYDIYIKDMRFGNFQGYYLPEFDKSIEDPKKGIVGNCEFQFGTDLLGPRTDHWHDSMKHDTTFIEFYVVDRAGHESNHLTTPKVIMYKK